MKEGSIVPAINRMPNISLEEGIKMEMAAMRMVMEIPGVRMVVTNIGRGESPADTQGQNESTPIATLKPRDEWPKGWNQDTIADTMRDKLYANLPGVHLVMAQPISDRVDEMVTGVRSDVAIKLFGDDLDVLRDKANEIARVAGGVRGVRDMRVGDMRCRRVDADGNVGITACVAFMVRRMGGFRLNTAGLDQDDLELYLIDHGLEEMGEGTGEKGEPQLVIRCNFPDFGQVQKALEDRGLATLSATHEYICLTPTELPEDQAREVLEMVDRLEQDDDVQQVYHTLA
jgi:hypothetical protein